MSQKSSVPQAISFVSQVLKRDTWQLYFSPSRVTILRLRSFNSSWQPPTSTSRASAGSRLHQQFAKASAEHMVRAGLLQWLQCSLAAISGTSAVRPSTPTPPPLSQLELLEAIGKFPALLFAIWWESLEPLE